MVDIGDDDSGEDVGSNDVWRGRVESVLVSLSNSYFEDKISVGNSRLSSCPAYTSLLTTSDYCLNQIVCNFNLRRSFYSRQYFKNFYHSSI